MAVSEKDLAELRSWAAGAVEAVDWTAVELPPCVNRVRRGATTVTRRARVVRAYYEPEVISPQLDREVRIADRQAVVVSPDGTILGTWRVPLAVVPEQPRPQSARRPERRSDAPRPVRSGPKDQAGLLRMLEREGLRMERTARHIRVLAPEGPVYIPSTPSDPRSVRNSVALLRKFGATLRHDG